MPADPAASPFPLSTLSTLLRQGMHNPLDGVDVHAVRDSHDRPVLGQHQYFLKVVPTEYHATRGAVIETNQFSVTEHFKPSGGMGQELTGIFFFYDLSPIKAGPREGGVRGLEVEG